MALKDVLVHVDDSKATATRVESAIQLAIAHEAHLTGLYVLPDQAVISHYVEAHIPGDILEAQRKAALTAVDEAERAFSTAADRACLSAEWRFVEGYFTQTLSLHARYVDLLIAGQADNSDALSMGEHAVEHLVLDVGRPVLLIPYIGPRDTLGERVLVAWDASREAMRAIHDALPLLERAKEVHVLTINTPGGSSGAVESADISLHLARHNIKVEAEHIEADDINSGDILLSSAANQQADLIVMGAYGHSRFRELVLGGATRHVLQYMTVPVLMSH